MVTSGTPARPTGVMRIAAGSRRPRTASAAGDPELERQAEVGVGVQLEAKRADVEVERLILIENVNL